MLRAVDEHNAARHPLQRVFRFGNTRRCSFRCFRLSAAFGNIVYGHNAHLPIAVEHRTVALHRGICVQILRFLFGRRTLCSHRSLRRGAAFRRHISRFVPHAREYRCRQNDHRGTCRQRIPRSARRVPFRRCAFLMQTLHHTRGKALGRVVFLQTAKRRLHRCQLREVCTAALACFDMCENGSPLLFVQFSVKKGRNLERIRFTVFHFALISSRLHSVTFDEAVSKKFPLAVK